MAPAKSPQRLLLISVALAALLKGSQAAAIVVNPWTFNTPSASDPQQVSCGDTVTFTWSTGTTTQHNVHLELSNTVPVGTTAICAKPTAGNLVATGTSGTVTVPFISNGFWTFSCTVGTHCTNGGMHRIFQVTGCPEVCFPETSTVRRVSATGALETVTLPELRVGDSVECLEREPVFRADGTLTSSVGGHLSTCQVYDYKKAFSSTQAQYTFITYDRPEAAKPGVLVASPNHHVLNPKTNQATHAGSVSVDDELLVLYDGAFTTAHVLSVKTATAKGAFVPLLTKGGLPIVDGAVVYPSSGESDVGLDAKFWGQYFLSAPVWQALEAKASNDAAGKSLAELGARPGMEVGAFTQKFYAVAAAAAKEGRTFKDWAGVAAEMRGAIAGGKVYSEEEALAVYDKHIKAPQQQAAVMQAVA